MIFVFLYNHNIIFIGNNYKNILKLTNKKLLYLTKLKKSSIIKKRIR